MKLCALSFFALCFGAFSGLVAQTLAPRTPAASPANATQLQELIKKVDEQNTKIDMLSQQILRLEQQIANLRLGGAPGEATSSPSARPGVMIGEATPSSPTSPSAADSPRSANGGNTHTVARGETLTSIAKMYSISVSELQKYNHIENPLKLQAGQTLAIPASPAPSSSPSPTD
jgi:LysM repeat protein